MVLLSCCLPPAIKLVPPSFLREKSSSQKQHYLDSGYGSEASLRRHGSALSLGSVSISSMSKAGMSKCNGNGWGLLEKINEVETYRDILCRQVSN